MNECDENIPSMYNKRVVERVDAGLKPTMEFLIKMSIQSAFDMRRMVTIL